MRNVILWIFFTVVYSANAQEQKLKDFLSGMSSGEKHLDHFFLLADSLQGRVFVNFVLIENFEIKRETDRDFRVYIDTGTGKYSMELFFRMSISPTNPEEWLIVPNIDGRKFRDLYLLDPWASKRKIE